MAGTAGTMSGQPALPRLPSPDGATPEGATPQSDLPAVDVLTLPPAVQHPSFADRVALLCQDHAARNFAMRLAGNREVAEDAIQETYYAVSRVADPDVIEDLRKYVCRALRNQVMRLSEHTGPRPAEDVDAVLAMAAARGRRPPLRNSPCEDSGMRAAQEARWLARLQGPVAADVPGRSAEPRRYRHAVADVACWALRALLQGDLSTADMNDRLISRHREWFAATGSSPNTCHKRLSRARQDVINLLASVISRDELLP